MTASVWVAMVALAAATGFNMVALRRSGQTLKLAEQTFARTEERYKADRLEARDDRLRDALIDVSVAVGAYNVVNAWYVKLLRDFVSGHSKAGVVQDHDVDKLRPAAADAYRAIKTAQFIADDQPIVDLLTALDALILAATHVVTKADAMSAASVERAATEARNVRKQAATKAVDLVTVAKRTIKHRKAKQDHLMRSADPAPGGTGGTA